MTTIEPRVVHLLSDTVLYREAVEFVEQHAPLPDTSQLIGLLTFARTWGELLKFIHHQASRDWGRSKEHYPLFYNDLKKYLSDSRTGLRQRVKTEFQLIDGQLSKNDERQGMDDWAQTLSQEFIQHLVAEARLQRRN